MLFGCIAAAALALLVDQLLGAIEAGVARRSRWRVAAGVAALAVGHRRRGAAAGRGARRRTWSAAKNFSEQFILAELLSARIAAGGGAAAQRTGLGSAIVFGALANGDIDVYVDYSGTIWANVMRRTDVPRRERDARARSARGSTREHGIVMLGALGFENAYGLAMRRDRAERLGIATIADLARACGRARRSAAISSSSRGPNGRATASATGFSSRADASSSRPSCIRPSSTATST